MQSLLPALQALSQIICSTTCSSLLALCRWVLVCCAQSRGWATGWANPSAAAAARQFAFLHSQTESRGETNVLGNKAVLAFINSGSEFHKWEQTSWPACLCHMVLSWRWTLLWETYSLNQWEPGEWEKTSLHLSEEKGWGLGRGHQRYKKYQLQRKLVSSTS